MAHKRHEQFSDQNQHELASFIREFVVLVLTHLSYECYNLIKENRKAMW